MTCPNCHTDLTPTYVGTLTACGACHRTLAREGDGLRLAVDRDVVDLSPEDKQALRALRNKTKVPRRFH